jgi:SAM-dependent methyltransferase
LILKTDATPAFLHIGCGGKRKDQTTRGFNKPEWQEIRVDIDPKVQPDIVASITDMSAVPDESVDAIFTSHTIEHLYPHEVPIALREFLTVLKPEGFAVIVVVLRKGCSLAPWRLRVLRALPVCAEGILTTTSGRLPLKARWMRRLSEPSPGSIFRKPPLW